MQWFSVLLKKKSISDLYHQNFRGKNLNLLEREYLQTPNM
ncbi:hypothetical protein FUAX_11580 [Fulvitalea axinellae]|uniref:Uncharacterized protein n=1 Tax=Fulvitalea axinellae TaxID=1182444 RepID=A0AAU9D783_9BACT|nr:hypothetical protein FUAX_11580 [Fulvitalea axinellae]